MFFREIFKVSVIYEKYSYNVIVILMCSILTKTLLKIKKIISMKNESNLLHPSIQCYTKVRNNEKQHDLVN